MSHETCSVVELVVVQWQDDGRDAVPQAVIQYPGTCMMNDKIVTWQMACVGDKTMLVEVFRVLCRCGGGAAVSEMKHDAGIPRCDVTNCRSKGGLSVWQMRAQRDEHARAAILRKIWLRCVIWRCVQHRADELKVWRIAARKFDFWNAECEDALRRVHGLGTV